MNYLTLEKTEIKMHSNRVKLEVLQEELQNCQSLGGYMASANVVQSYLEKRVFALENKVRYEEKQPEDSIDAHDG